MSQEDIYALHISSCLIHTHFFEGFKALRSWESVGLDEATAVSQKGLPPRSTLLPKFP